jgi:hypothetical protein
MKKLILPFFSLLLTSCTVTNYYQVYKTNTENGTVIENNIVFEDDNCSVHYNLWKEGGNMGFSIYNKTENNLTVDLTKTFFVLNGVAFEYFQNRTFTRSSNIGATVTKYNYPYYRTDNITNVTGSNSAGFSTTYIEKPQLTIPAKTHINISEYIVTNTLFTDCNLPKYPTRKNLRTLKYSADNSPFSFYNIITYSTTADTLKIENKFYVSEITNYLATEMYARIDTSNCGKKLDFPIRVFKEVTPDKFYIKYILERY